jgi:hypothetical protein
MAETKSVGQSPDTMADFPAYKYDGDGAITIKRGTGYITKGTAAALTLALPTAGADDGKRIRLVDTVGAAHTVTTPSLGINAVNHIATFGGTIGQVCELEAFNGSWWNKGTGITIS